MILPGLRGRTKDNSGQSSWIDFQVISNLFFSYSELDADQKEFIKELGLSSIYSPVFWQESSNSSESDALMQAHSKIRNVVQNFPALINALSLTEEKYGELNSGSGIVDRISIIIPDESHKNIKSDHFANLLISIQSLYDVICSIEQIDSSSLSILSLDSGSDKVIVFGGLGQAIEKLKELMIEIWDRIALGGFGRRQAELNFLGKSLSLVPQIEALVDQKIIDPEDGERLKRKLFDSSRFVVETGAITIEQEERQLPSVRQISHLSQALLTGPDQNDAEPPTQNGGSAQDRDIEKENAELRRKVAELEKGRETSGAARPKKTTKG